MNSNETSRGHSEANARTMPPASGSKLFLLIVLCATVLYSVSNALAAAAIVTAQGPLKGIETLGVIEYLGIPYATPPVGDLRWMPPQPPAPFHGLFHATQFGNICPQAGGHVGVRGNEDCLFLNVYVPNVANDLQPERGFPVMVWIHGGGLINGASSIYDPSPLVEQGGVIVVTINYRLGFLGFFAHPALDAEGHLNANYGFMDQQFALKWVRQNIGAFGGNRDKITIFGESAGGQSVYSQLASPLAAGLFQGAISESGSYSSFASFLQTIVPLPQAETEGTAIVTAIGSCPIQTSACLRTLGVADLVNRQPFPVEPIVDGTLLTQPLGAAFASGNFNRVPVISGTNHDEYRIFVASAYDYQGHPLVTLADYEAGVAAIWGPFFGPKILALYPFASYPSPGIALGASVTDAIFSCTARRADKSLSAHTSTYAYEFNDENAPNLFNPPATFPLGAFHFAEVPYLFTVGFTPAPFTPAQQSLSETMISYWTQFAKTGNPNGDGLPQWPIYTTQGAHADEFESLVPPTPSVETTFATDHKCSTFWDFFN